MNVYAQYELYLTDHAFERYLERGGSLEREDLIRRLNEQIQINRYRADGGFIQIDEVWWAFVIRENTMRLVTCYGRTLLDIPKAVVWAKRQRDSINLNDLLEPEYGTTS